MLLPSDPSSLIQDLFDLLRHVWVLDKNLLWQSLLCALSVLQQFPVICHVWRLRVCRGGWRQHREHRGLIHQRLQEGKNKNWAVSNVFVTCPLYLSVWGGLKPRGCVIRGTARPSGQPSRFIISQCQRHRRGNSADQWAKVEARLNFLSKCGLFEYVSLTCMCRWTRWCVFLISLPLVILSDFHSSVLYWHKVMSPL